MSTIDLAAEGLADVDRSGLVGIICDWTTTPSLRDTPSARREIDRIRNHEVSSSEHVKPGNFW